MTALKFYSNYLEFISLLPKHIFKVFAIIYLNKYPLGNFINFEKIREWNSLLKKTHVDDFLIKWNDNQ